MSRVLAAIADEVERTGQYTRVESSNLYAVWYQADFRRLFVWFGGTAKQPRITRYVYEDVPAGLAAGLLAAGSKGEFLDARIKKAGYGYIGPL